MLLLVSLIMDMTGHRQREEAAFNASFAVGEAIIRYMRQHQCSKSAACVHFASKYPLGESALKAAHTTARTFPPQERNRAVGYSKHQSLAQVSRKNLPFLCTDEEYQAGLREALAEIAREDIPVNGLNGSGPNSARNVLLKAIRRLRRRRQGADDRNEAREVRFPLARGARPITTEDVKHLDDEA